MRRVEDFIGNLEEKAAAKVRGQIWDGPIAQNDPYVMFLLCAKFHTFYDKVNDSPQKWYQSALLYWEIGWSHYFMEFHA